MAQEHYPASWRGIVLLLGYDPNYLGMNRATSNRGTGPATHLTHRDRLPISSKAT